MLAYVQGGYWLLTGLWALLDRGSFESLTGPKLDYWLVETVGALVAVVGFTLIIAGLNRRLTPEIILLAAAAALALGAVESWYAAIGRIRPIYFADAVLEVLLVLGWLRVALSPRFPRRSPRVLAGARASIVEPRPDSRPG